MNVIVLSMLLLLIVSCSNILSRDHWCFRLHLTRSMQPIATDDRGICQSVCSVGDDDTMQSLLHYCSHAYTSVMPSLIGFLRFSMIHC